MECTVWEGKRSNWVSTLESAKTRRCVLRRGLTRGLEKKTRTTPFRGCCHLKQHTVRPQGQTKNTGPSAWPHFNPPYHQHKRQPGSLEAVTHGQPTRLSSLVTSLAAPAVLLKQPPQQQKHTCECTHTAAASAAGLVVREQQLIQHQRSDGGHDRDDGRLAWTLAVQHAPRGDGCSTHPGGQQRVLVPPHKPVPALLHVLHCCLHARWGSSRRRRCGCALLAIRGRYPAPDAWLDTWSGTWHS